MNKVDPKGLTPEEGLAAVAANRALIIRVANRYNIQPELLAGVVFRESHGKKGWIPNELMFNEWYSKWKLMRKKVSTEQPPSIGKTQRQALPASQLPVGGNIDLNPLSVPDERQAREIWYRQFMADKEAQLVTGARQLVALMKSKLRCGDGPMDRLDRQKMSIVLTEYANGPKREPPSGWRDEYYQREGKPVVKNPFGLDPNKVRRPWDLARPSQEYGQRVLNYFDQIRQRLYNPPKPVSPTPPTQSGAARLPSTRDSQFSWTPRREL